MATNATTVAPHNGNASHDDGHPPQYGVFFYYRFFIYLLALKNNDNDVYGADDDSPSL
jgi:hypothetical protein